MRTRNTIAMMIAAAGFAAPAVAQDSVSNTGTGLPGDAISFLAADQRQDFVVDMTPFMTSRGNTFGMAPIVKASQSATGFFSSLFSAQAMSSDLLSDVAFPASAYALWEATPGAGVGPNNSMPGSIEPAGLSFQFAAGMNEFSTTDAGANYNGVVGALVNYQADAPNRLYVSRIQVAGNTPLLGDGDVAQLGGLSVDANGNFYFRADDFGVGSAAGFTPVADQNIFRVRAADRNASVPNIISGMIAMSGDATDGLIVGSMTTHPVSGNIPQSLVGGNGFMSGANFNGEWVRGGTSGTITSDAVHLGTSPSQRGSISGSTRLSLDSGVYTQGVLAKDDLDDRTTVLRVWSSDAAGSVVETYGFEVPSMLSDNTDPFVLNTGLGEFLHYLSQVPFRGGVGQVAVGEDQMNRGLAAATFSENNFTDDFSSQVAVVRFNEDGTGAEWTLAAWYDQINNVGKPLTDGMGGSVGQISALFNVPGAPLGPSISSPVIDSVGNVWFIAAVELFNRIDSDGDGVLDTSDFDSAVVRAIYNPATFGYELELVAELGQVFDGRNSGVPYQIQFLQVADSNSLASGTMFSGNGSSRAWADIDVADLDSTEDTRSNGGMVFAAEIVYDVDGDGDFSDPSGAGGDPASADESYNALLYIGCFDCELPTGGCPADFNGDDIADFFDVQAFLAAFAGMDPAADFTMDGMFDFFDVQEFLSLFAAGCP